jgi:hypothetical protein
METAKPTSPLPAARALRRLGAQLLLGALVLGGMTALVPRRGDGGDLPGERARLAAARAELVLIGNSLVRQDLDDAALAELLGVRVAKLTVGGAQSAWWYLALKNVAAPAEPPPRLIAVGFQDLALTEPGRATAGIDGANVRAFMDGGEPLLRERALESALGAPLLSALEHVPLWAVRESARTQLEQLLRDGVVAPLLGLPLGGGSRGFAAALSNARMDRALLAAYQTRTTNPESDAPEFERVVDASLLPAMVDAARARPVRLVFLRMPRLSDARGLPEHSALTRYVERLAAWLAARDAALIDLTREVPLEPADFDAGDHLAASGAAKVTAHLAERLRALLPADHR